MSTVTTLLNLVKPASPEQFSLATYNNNLDLIDAKAVNHAASIKSALKAFGVHGANATWGTIPVAATSDLKFIFGSNPHTPDAAGNVGVDMPASFPNGYIVIALLNGDVAANPNLTLALATTGFTNLANKFFVNVRVANTNALVTTALRLNYLVVGH